MAIIRKTATGKVVGSMTYILSDATVDRYGDIIEPSGWELDNFRANPIALFGHAGSFPIGTWANVRVEKGKLLGEFVAAKSGTSQRIDEIISLIEQDILRATSVGFQPLEHVPLNPKEPYGGQRYTSQELLETSIVSVPANPAALQVAKALHVSDETMSLVFGAHADTRRRDMSPGAHADPKSSNRRTMSVTLISTQIEDRQSQLNAARDELNELIKDADHDVEQADLLQDQIEEHERRLTSLQRTEKALAIRTIEHQPQPPQQTLPAPMVSRRPFGIPTKETKPVDLIYRMLAVRLRAEVTRRPVEDMLHLHYPDDEATAIVTRAAVTGATTTGAGWAIDLVQLAQGEFVNTLYPNSVFPKVAAMGTALSFGPNAGAIKIPSRTTTPSIGGSFVAEAAPIPVRRLGTTSITLYPHKVGGISVYSREIAAYSNPDIEALIRDSIVNDTSINVDGLLLDNVAVSTTRPAGLTNGVAAITASTAKGYAAFLADLQSLSTPFYNANAGRNLALIMSPVQRQQLIYAPGPTGVPFGWSDQFTGMFSVIASTTIAAGSVYMIDCTDFVSVSGAPEFEVSEVATLHMEDTTPLQIVTGAQGSGVVASPTQSMFQTGQIAIRMLANVSWAMRRAGMVQFMTGANWGP